MSTPEPCADLYQDSPALPKTKRKLRSNSSLELEPEPEPEPKRHCLNSYQAASQSSNSPPFISQPSRFPPSNPPPFIHQPSPFPPTNRISDSVSRLSSWLESVVDPLNPPTDIPPRLCHSAPIDMFGKNKRKDKAKEAMPPPAPQSKSCPPGGPSNQASMATPPSTSGHNSAWENGSTRSATSASTQSRRTASSSKTNVMEQEAYRFDYLNPANIEYTWDRRDLPADVSALVDSMGRDRDSPDPPSVQYSRVHHRVTAGASEDEVIMYMQGRIFPNPEDDVVSRSDNKWIDKNDIPPSGPDAKKLVVNPVPDMMYGYQRDLSFTRAQAAQLAEMGQHVGANSRGLLLPFFVVEFKGVGGNLWVAENQCLGGSASCVHVADRLNKQLQKYSSTEVTKFDNTTFSVALNGSEARLYVSWKQDDLYYYMNQVNAFALFKPDDFKDFRKHVRNIIDWGKDKRLKAIRDSLDELLEERRRVASQQAKARSRSPPSEGRPSKR